MRLASLLAAILVAIVAENSRLHAADSGNSVIVVYNKRMEESKRVADHYAARRNVPADQVLGLSLPRLETISREEFNNLLRDPLWSFLQKRKFVTIKQEKGSSELPSNVSHSSVRYLVLCYGVPARILKDSSLKEPVAEEKLARELRRNEASVDSELTLLPAIGRKLPLAGPLINAYFGTTNANSLNPTNGILLVGRLDGPSEAIANGLVDKALAAEENGLWGRAYFDVRGITDNDYKLGDTWFSNGSLVCKRAGFETVVDEQAKTFPVSFPLSQVAIYGGWYDHQVSGPFTRATVEFMPGAVAYHLHSFSAHEIRSPDKYWVGPLLARGATVTMGSVDEPYLGGTPDFGTFCGLFVGMGFSFGEAAFASQNALSWQTVAIGDPLYRPFAQSPQAQHQNLERRKSSLVEWSHLKVVNLNLATGIKPAEIIPYLEETLTTATSAVLTEKLGELYLETGKTAKGIELLRRAIDRQPSPLQRVRLWLRVAALQEASNSRAAYDAYEELLRAAPDYPDLAGIHKSMLVLAQKLDLKEAILRHERESKR